MEGASGISHRTVEVNGIRMHVAEKGEGPPVLLLHGFPELWYTWRHQIAGLAARGYRAIAPDLRGYGDTDAPPDVASYTVFHLVGDLVALLDTLALSQVFVVGHDWGAFVAWHLCMLRPDRVKALVNLSVPFMSRNPAAKPLDRVRASYGDEYYIIRFQEHGAAEAEFARLGTATVLRKFFTYRNPGPLFMPKEGWCSPNEQIPLPFWLSEEDINYLTSKFEKSGFTGPINYYRCLDLNWELAAPWTGAQIKVPTKFIIGDLDLNYHDPPLMQDYIHKGGFQKDVPLLREVVVMEGVAHFINQEKAQEITDHIYDFIRKF
ncbi:epoxide hydrolase 1 isoform X1 [Elaeis guineensis]|uniref:soluble epoxide hydrolase n=1 Tax=Elaeis guineensis var. tenera TaxID=51953 RepID=A0A6I9QUL2_ELAGV|nr:epoxide hydrolase A isoform X1 [Elaeis guineensis]